MAERVWHRRFRELKEDGFTKEQAIRVHKLLDESRTFGSQALSESARASLNEVYEEGDHGS